ncbi:FAD-dependent oxidoreductase [Rhizobium sp. DKSPLA3]|uniref:FAD-dependent oxidoreductase n=1 Tax=Rhizobium quercicola TaxID=2901226 RepID=A0A9X1SZK8_9HYPH|nr:FAD-dependent oxidoreductase [Rhizobium quercicola]MCD7107725.1 FAD-dependent oxidoreductase [Rhizobium quercicola]
MIRLVVLIKQVCFALGLCVLFGSAQAAAAVCQRADVVVYGGTPGGIAAAIQAARLKKTVILLEPTAHIGGLMSNGLTKTDASPRKNVYGGITAEFLGRAKAYYGTPDPIRIYFESKWAESTFADMLATAKVRVEFGERILKATKVKAALTEIAMVSGNAYCATVFIDASYEGDLMFKAAVDTMVGRESRKKYGESAAGVQRLARPLVANKQILVDPYVIPGNSQSGLLPGVIGVGQKPLGSADTSMMAFNYRLCVTDTADNRIPFSKPDGYDPVQYETTARFFAAMEKAGLGIDEAYFVGRTLTVRNKLDVNSLRYFSTNVWHIGYDYTMGTEAVREQIRTRVRNHIAGLMWFGQTDPRVPEHVRQYMTKFGYCADEFTDNGGFPHQMYVRQARRLIGQFVLTQKDLVKKTTYKDTIGLGFYPMDEHGMIRTVLNGYVADEARESISVGPYEIPYRAMLPKASQTTNLIVPVAISSSHAAFTSVRVEPTFMVLGQAAGAAAALAPSGNVSKVNVNDLRKKLSAAGQILKF